MSEPGLLDVHLLGQARICVDGAPIKFAKRASTIAMLAYLILQRGRAVSRETLAFTLFPDLTETEASKELRRYLYLAQKALPQTPIGWIEADAETVRWNTHAPAKIDVVEFERLSAAAAGGEAAVALYEGDLLPEIYDDWVLAERERLRARYAGVLWSLILTARSARDFGRAVAYAQQLLAFDPWREDGLRQIIAARYEMGDAAGALAEYERFALTMRAELAAEPMSETRALRDIIARGSSLPSSLDRKRGDDRTRILGGLPFAGRLRDCERIRHAWERAARGQGSILAIEGEPGIGKSRLAAEFAIRAEAEGGRVLAGTTSFPEIVPYQCVIEILRAGLLLVDGKRTDDLRTRVLARVLPELQVEGRQPQLPPEVEAGRQQSRLFDAIGATIVSLARTRPLCIVLEDLHWAGPGTLDLLRFLARRMAQAAVLVIVTFRDEEVEPEHQLRAILHELAAEGLAVRIALGRLTRDDIAAVVATFADTARLKLDPDMLLSSSEGNPLFLNEAIGEALESDPAKNGVRATATIIERRLLRLSPEARRIAAVAAVCGNAFDADVVCSAAGTSGAQGLVAIDELLDRHVVREAGNAAGFAYAFAHHLIAATLYATLPADERAARHARIARALERFHHLRLETSAAEIARHYLAAAEFDRATHWYARAARSARSMFAHDEAARFATLALENCTDSSERVDLLLLREAAHAHLGRRTAQIHDLDLLDTEVQSGEASCESFRRRIALLRTLDDRDAERQTIAALRARAGTIGDRRWHGVADCAEAWLEVSLGRYADAEPLARRAVDALIACGKHAEQLEALAALAEIQVVTGRAELAGGTLAQAQAIAQDAHDDRSLAAVLMQAVTAAVAAQHFDRALATAQRAAALFRGLGDSVGEARAQVSIATAALRGSQWDIARRANLSAATTFELMGDRSGLARVCMNLAMLHGRCGALAQGRRYLLRAREHQERLKDDRAITASLLNESFLALWQQRPDEARDLARQALDRATRMNHVSYRAQALANLGAAERDLGQLEAALAHMEEGLELQLPLGRLPDAVGDLADIALAYALRGNLPRAAEHIERILALDRTWTNAAIFPPYPPWIAARVLHARGDSRASAILAWAVQLTQSFGASIDVPELRASFAALPFVAEIQAAARTNCWPAFTGLPNGVRDASGTPV